MSVKVKQLFDGVGITKFESINWGDINTASIPNKLGVYIVELSELQKEPDVDKTAILNWLNNSRNVSVGNEMATSRSIIAELNKHWKDSEAILYIGQTSTSEKGLQKRIKDFHTHKPGNKGPHAGGYWIKLLSDLDKLKVHFAVCENAYDIEFKLLIQFVMLTAKQTDIMKVENLGKYLPFANRTADFDKAHGIKGAIKSKI